MAPGENEVDTPDLLGRRDFACIIKMILNYLGPLNLITGVPIRGKKGDLTTEWDGQWTAV